MRKVSFERDQWDTRRKFYYIVLIHVTALILHVFFIFHIFHPTTRSENTLAEIVRRKKKKQKEEKKLFSTSLLFNVLTIFQSLVNNEEEERGSGYPEWRTFEIRCIYPGLELRRSTECNHFISTFTRESPGGPPPICPPFYNLAHNKGETSLWEIDERATMLSRRPPADLSSHHRVCFALLASLRPPSVIDSDLSVEKDDTRECRIRRNEYADSIGG